MELLQYAIPPLAFLKIAKNVQFYQEKMGLDKIGRQDEHYAVVGRDNVKLHFWKCNDKIHPENASCYIYAEEIDALHRELKAAGVLHPNGPLEDRPWGTREFAVLDEDGNCITFGKDL